MPIDTHLDANPADITASAAAVEKIKHPLINLKTI